ARPDRRATGGGDGGSVQGSGVRFAHHVARHRANGARTQGVRRLHQERGRHQHPAPEGRRLQAGVSSLALQEDRMANVLDPYMVDSEVSFLDKAKIQAQVLVPVVRALRAELGKAEADALVKQALSGWSRQLFAEIGKDIEGGRRRWAKMQGA